MKHSVQNFSISLKRIMIACNAEKKDVTPSRTSWGGTSWHLKKYCGVLQKCLWWGPCTIRCLETEFFNCVLGWVGRAGGARLGILWQREISDVETWGGAPQSFFYGRGGVRLEIDRCRVIGAGSHLKQPDYHCWVPTSKKVKIWEEAWLRFPEVASSYHLIGLNPFDLIGRMNLMSSSAAFMRHCACSARW